MADVSVLIGFVLHAATAIPPTSYYGFSDKPRTTVHNNDTARDNDMVVITII